MARQKKKKRRWLLPVLLILAAVVVGGMVWKNKTAPKGTEVETEQSEVKTIKEIVSASGRIYPEVEVVISSDVSGEIVNLFVEEGDSVVTGQVLLKIDPEAYVSSVRRGEADLNNARAGVAQSKAQIETNKAQREESVTQLTQAHRVHKRNTQLFKDGIISQVEFDESLSSVERLEAGIRSADANIRAAQENTKGAEFMVNSSEAVLSELRTNLNRTTIKAPNSGIITSLSIEKGERVVGTAQMAGTEIMRISNLNTMEAQVEVSENDILKVTMSDEVEIEVDAYIDKVFKGHVTEIANSATNVAGTTSATASLNTDQVTNFIVKIRLDPSSYADEIADGVDYPFRPGMSASVSIITDVKTDILTVPIQSVTVRVLDEESDDDEYEEIVFVYEADTARIIKVKTGIQDDESIQIISGLEADTEIISGPYIAVSKELEEGSELRRKEDDDKKEK